MVKDWKERIVIDSIGTDGIRRKTRPAPLPVVTVAAVAPARSSTSPRIRLKRSRSGGVLTPGFCRAIIRFFSVGGYR